MKNTVQYKLFLVLSLCFFFFLLSTQNPPNFVLIVSDDQGWNGTSFLMDESVPDSKSDYYQTPAIEALAQSGMTFSRGYAPAPKCSPTRVSIMTGKTPARNKFTTTGNGTTSDRLLVTPMIDSSIDLDEITIAEWLKATELGYRTAHFGKWHLGADGTASHGFDEGDGNTNNNDGDNGGTVQEDPKKIFELTDKAIAFAQQAVTDNVPFYVQVSHYAVHSPLEANQATLELYNDTEERPLGDTHTNVEFGAMTEDMDTGIGQLLEALSALGLDDNTYVIFISDNGAANGQSSNVPLRRGKTFLFEGGIRVPFIIKGPGIAPNSRSDEPVIAYDFFPTLAELTESTLALPADLDGNSIVPLLMQTEFERTQPLYFHSPHYETIATKVPRSALIDGEYKFMVNYETGENLLYHLGNDIGETNDLAAQESVLTRNLCIQMRDYLKEIDADMPKLDPSHNNFSGVEPDVDEDGLDDDWEFRELLSYHFGPDDDPDGDGIPNLQEYEAGTDPYSMNVGLNDELYPTNKITVFPNPTTQILQIKLNELTINLPNELRLRIIDAGGRTLIESHIEKSEILSLDIGQLNSGLYQLIIVEKYIEKPLFNSSFILK